VKRNPQIFWLPLLIGHALLSNPAAHRNAVALIWPIFQECAGRYPRVFGRLAAMPLG
jgi:hypothetical protein